jgi:hypothetical protein
LKTLNELFLISIVIVESFSLSKNFCELTLLCIENDEDINYSLRLTNIAYVEFRQEFIDDEFEVIDTILERFNESECVKFMKSSKWDEYWIIRFHSGVHHLIIGFEKFELHKISLSD